MKKTEFELNAVSCSAKPLIFDESKCVGCLSCARVCQVDILFPPEEKGKPPRVMYPGECYYCGSCVMACPVEGAIRLNHPLMNKTAFAPVINPDK